MSVTYRDTIASVWRENRIFTVLVELTFRCNLDCVFCYNDLEQTGRPMALSDYERFFEDLAGLGCLHLTLSGGEPLAHRDFFAIGAAANRLGFVTRIKSNGHNLRGRVLQRLLDEVDPFIVEVSLHGAHAETHDRQTRVPGSFDRLMRNLEAMRAAGVRVKLNSTLTKWNEDELEAMHAIASKLGFAHSVSAEVTPRDNGDMSPLALSASAAAQRRLLESFSDHLDSKMPATDGDKHCGAGAAGVAVDPFGNVYPCVQWRRRLGNLHERSIGEIWDDPTELAVIRETTAEVKRRGASAAFCPGAEVLRRGTPFPDSDSLLQIDAPT